MSTLSELRQRERAGEPVRIAVVGTGYMGRGLLRRSARMPGLVAPVAANRTLDRAVAALADAGYDPRRIRVCTTADEANAALAQGLAVATAVLTLPAELNDIDVVMEATGDVSVGAAVALAAIQHGKHIVASNAETQATVGPLLQALAEEAGVIYSDVDGDQPGLIKRLYDWALALGFEPLVAGNCKGVLKRYATPATQAAFAAATGIKPWIASAAADGTKIAFEMAIVANATGMPPAVPGMTGLQTTLDTLLPDLAAAGLLDRGPIIEYTLGIPSGVFLVFRGDDDPALASEFAYLKMGAGPYYVAYHPHVLIHYESALSAAEAALFHTATIAPVGAPVADVIAFAKQDLGAGATLDEIGGYDTYGLVVRAEEAAARRWLPVGLAPGARLTRAVAKDEPLSYDAVEFPRETLALTLRRQQDARFGRVASLPAAV